MDLSEFEAFSPNAPKPCKLVSAAEQLSDPDREKLMAAVASSSITAGQVEKWAATRGLSLGSRSVSRHRRGECPCRMA